MAALREKQNSYTDPSTVNKMPNIIKALKI